MEVSLFPNLRRPGFGLKPKRESQRPLLPQHARHCPVLEAGSGLGFMVHPPLAEHELYQVGYEGEGRYQLTYSINPEGSRWEPIFTVNFILPIGGIGATSEEVKMLVDATPESNSTARLMARMFIVPEDLGTPAGAVTLRGAWNFQTPPGWDTVYTPIFNMIERPIAPMMVIRVETDWYVHDTEFRYVLQPGETVSASHNLPIGQVLFVPREEITLREGTEAEASARLQTSNAFFQEKSASKIKTPYGLEYSPHYLRTSRQRNSRPESPSPAKTPLPESAEKPGRNDPCPCGSGRKYKRCHGENV
jgi:SEC-C motif